MTKGPITSRCTRQCLRTVPGRRPQRWWVATRPSGRCPWRTGSEPCLNHTEQMQKTTSGRDSLRNVQRQTHRINIIPTAMFIFLHWLIFSFNSLKHVVATPVPNPLARRPEGEVVDGVYRRYPPVGAVKVSLRRENWEHERPRKPPGPDTGRPTSWSSGPFPSVPEGAARKDYTRRWGTPRRHSSPDGSNLPLREQDQPGRRDN